MFRAILHHFAASICHERRRRGQRLKFPKNVGTFGPEPRSILWHIDSGNRSSQVRADDKRLGDWMLLERRWTYPTVYYITEALARKGES
jgi:hypothetical protein